MNEMLLGGFSGAPSGPTILDIDFSRQSLGDTTITSANTPVPFTKSGTGSPVVVNDPVMGLCMQFDALSMFATPMTPALAMSKRNFTLEWVFKETGSLVVKYPWATGDYVSAGAIEGGIVAQLNGGVGGTQLFLTTSKAEYVRAPYAGGLNQWVTLIAKWDYATKTFTVKGRDGVTYPYNVPEGFGDGTQLSLGGSYLRGAANSGFTGLIKSFKITEGI